MTSLIRLLTLARLIGTGPVYAQTAPRQPVSQILPNLNTIVNLRGRRAGFGHGLSRCTREGLSRDLLHRDEWPVVVFAGVEEGR